MKYFLILPFFALLVNVRGETIVDVETFDVSLDGKIGLNFGPDFRLKSDSSHEMCRRQLKYFQESLDQNVLWARKMRDAWGNIPSGRFSGNVFDFGNYDQCLNLHYSSETVGEILGQHCTLSIPFDRVDQPQMAKINTFSRS